MTVEILGTVADGFERVADAFEANVADHDDVGAACAVRVGGEELVDLSAGVADPPRSGRTPATRSSSPSRAPRGSSARPSGLLEAVPACTA